MEAPEALKEVVMVVAALAAYKHDTLGRYLPTVLHVRLQANPIPSEISRSFY